MDQFANVGKRRRFTAGFSLIEVMVAVVVLATGLLALAALQGALARSSADAKARGAIMSTLTSRMSQLRQTPPGDGTTTFKCTGGAPAWVCATEQQANIGAGGLTFSQQVGTLLWKGGSFQAPASGDDLSGPAFKRFTLTATWTDAGGSSRALSLRSDASGLMYGLGYPNPPEGSSAVAKPVVRQKNPGLEAGVIPIAYGSGGDAQSTAASNPKPVLIGQSTVVGTQFDVLTYIPSGAEALIRRRVDTNLVKCRCSTNLPAKDRYSVAGVAQWPTVWNGEEYLTYKPTPATLPPGESLKAGEDPSYAGKNRRQSSLCTECCRDRHDETSMAVRFGPEGGTDRYNLASNGALTVSTSGDFVTACRVIRDEGIYKTASDMYLRQFALLETTPNPVDSTSPSNFAKDGTPKPAATTGYGNFVKEYLEGYLTSVSSSGTAPTTVAEAQQAFDDFDNGSLNAPDYVRLPERKPQDERFLHARGLYVDYLNPDAQKNIKQFLDKCTATDKLDCLLPHLAFTTINMTELAKWMASSDNSLYVTREGTLLGTSVNQPFGGRTHGLLDASETYTVANASLSNSTLAFHWEIPFVNADEANPDNWLKDQQQFVVGAGGSGGTDPLPYIEVVPRGLLPDIPLIRLPITLTGASGAGPCVPGTTSYICRTGAGGLPATVGLVIGGYNVKETSAMQDVTVVCSKNSSSTVGRPYSITYSSVSVSDTDGGAAVGGVSANPSPARSLNQISTWGTLSRQNGDRLFVTYSGGEKQCPTTATCQGNKFQSWGTTYTAAACAIDTYTP